MELYYDEVDGDVLVIKADGGLNQRNADQFVNSLESLIDAGLTKIIVDCTALDYISSYGLGVLVRLHRRLAARGGNVKLAGARGVIFEVLRLARLTTLLAIYPDVARARLAFRPRDVVEA